jgi:hypothetical protein
MIPNEVNLIIIQYLNIDDNLQLGSTCNYFRDLITSIYKNWIENNTILLKLSANVREHLSYLHYDDTFYMICNIYKWSEIQSSIKSIIFIRNDIIYEIYKNFITYNTMHWHCSAYSLKNFIYFPGAAYVTIDCDEETKFVEYSHVCPSLINDAFLREVRKKAKTIVVSLHSTKFKYRNGVVFEYYDNTEFKKLLRVGGLSYPPIDDVPAHIKKFYL